MAMRYLGALIINRKVLWTVSALLLVVGVVFKLVNLGTFSFWADEIYHVIASKALIERGEPVFPSGDLYTRAILFTKVVSLFIYWLGDAELNARLPALISSTLFIVIGFEYIRRRFTIHAAILFVFFSSFVPLNVDLARQARMYAPFGLFYFVAVISFFSFMTPSARTNKFARATCAIMCILSFFLAYLMHALALTIAVPSVSFIAVMATYHAIRGKGFAARFFNIYAIFSYVGFIVSGVLIVMSPETILHLVEESQYMPNWARIRGDFGPAFYFVSLFELFPLLVVSYPFLAAWLIYKYQELGLWITMNFTLLFAMHSLFFTWKEMRYIHYILPFFFLPFCIFVGHYLYRSGRMLRAGNKKSYQSLLVITLFAILIMSFNPWLRVSKYQVLKTRYPDWLAIPDVLHPKKLAGNWCTFTTAQNIYYYYAGKSADYYIRVVPEIGKKDAEYFGGARLIDSVEKLMAAVDGCSNSILYTDGMIDRTTYFTPEMKYFVFSQFDEQMLTNNSLRIFTLIRKPIKDEMP